MPPSTIVGPSKFKPYRPTSAPQPVSDAASGGGYSPARNQAPQPISDAASGGGYGQGATHALGAGAPTPNQAAANAAAKSSSSFNQYLAYLNSNMGRQPSLLDQLTQPIIQSYEAQARAGDAQIQQMTQVYAKQLQGIAAQSNAAYTTAENQQAALDTAVGSALQNGDVGAAASRLQQSLAMAGQSQAPAAQAASDVSSTGGSMYASASAGLTQLFSDAAATGAYNAQLPGLAALSGIQAIGAYNAGLSQAEASAVADAQKLIPQIMDAQNNQTKLGIDQFNANTNRARVNAQIAAEQAKASQPKIYGSGATGYFALTADGRNVQLTAPGQKQPKTFSSGGNEYTFNPSTGQVTQLTNNPKAPKAPTVRSINGVSSQYDPATGKWVPIGGGKGKVASPSSVNSYVKSITEFGTTHTKNPDGTTSNSRGVTGHTTSYGNAYKVLTSQYHLSDKDARAALDSTYLKGQDGRSWLTNEQQAVLGRAAAGVRQPKGIGLLGNHARVNDLTKVHVGPGNTGYITQDQYNVLRQAGMLPKIAKVSHDPSGATVYIIDPRG